MYDKPVVLTYLDFEEYFLEMKNDPAIGVNSVIVGDMEDVQAFQKNAKGQIYPLLFMHVPSFDSFNSGGDKNHFSSDFLILEQNAKNDQAAKSGIYNRTREIVLNIQKKMEEDGEKSMFEFDGKFTAEPRHNFTTDRCFGWFVSFEMATPGVGLDADYR